MTIRAFRYYVQEAFQSIYRNGWMSLVSIGVVAVTLFILGSFMLLNINVEHLTNEIKGQVEIIAYVEDDISVEALNQLRVSLIRLESVEEVRFVSKEEALDRLREQLGSLVDGYDNERNPLPNSFEIRTSVPEDIPAVAEEARGLPGIARVDYGSTDMIQKLFSFTGVIRWLGMAFMVGLAFTAMFLIANTIKLTVNARSQEIMIMKYVGATEWFVRWPFLIEGLFLGFFGALVPTVFLVLLYGEAVAWATLNLYFLPLVAPHLILADLARLLLLLGTAIGGLGSLVSMRRFLKV
jgi:cell division transport system permease protein